MLKIAGVIVCEIIMYTLLQQYKPEFAIILEAAFAVVLLFMLGSEVKEALGGIKSFFDGTGVSVEYMSVLIKILGLALITQFTADLCRDAGENAAASKVEFAGKVIITSASIPIIEGITGLIVKLIENV